MTAYFWQVQTFATGMVDGSEMGMVISGLLVILVGATGHGIGAGKKCAGGRTAGKPGARPGARLLRCGPRAARSAEPSIAGSE